ncbi:aminodeoxychorismate synthase component I [Salinisphaera sp. SPP-AMP-43]|uniref:aminodeoxychorismate synthase component I n=1 Tax=Salinisphaera sp. SPP-AMP-43 TaxID=3121288 RepID=UPI003C6DCF06
MTTEHGDQGRIVVSADLARLTLEAGHCPALHHLAAANPEVFPALLESSAGAAAQSRYDILLADPERVIKAEDFDDPAAFFDVLDELAAQSNAAGHDDLPFIGGWLIYLSYEMAQGVEPSLHLPIADDPLPMAMALRCTSAIVHDRQRHTVDIISEAGDDRRVEALRAELAAVSRIGPYSGPPSDAPLAAWHEDPPTHYTDAVTQAREYIRAGDVFQTNLARAWQGELQHDCTPADVYRALRASNPAPFSALVQWQGAALVCSSPERLLSIRGGRASVRPIAGTRRRYPGAEQRISRELITHPKERAEHVMLIDLVRNDLGRFCRPGTIEVDELMIVESYAHVHHIVSNVAGELASDIGPGAALKAVFPGGTITGCPKVRCMEIIAELETVGRGAYTGSVGYLSRCGTLDTNIVIRSITQKGRQMTLRAGAGIVADSEPQAELEETRHKAHGVLRAFAWPQGQSRG